MQSNLQNGRRGLRQEGQSHPVFSFHNEHWLKPQHSSPWHHPQPLHATTHLVKVRASFSQALQKPLQVTPKREDFFTDPRNGLYHIKSLGSQVPTQVERVLCARLL